MANERHEPPDPPGADSEVNFVLAVVLFDDTVEKVEGKITLFAPFFWHGEDALAASESVECDAVFLVFHVFLVCGFTARFELLTCAQFILLVLDLFAMIESNGNRKRTSDYWSFRYGCVFCGD